MKPICLIPARGGSKGIPKKNTRLLAKKPLIAHTIGSCLKSKLFSDVVVSTDDPEIARISKKYGARVPFMRPKELATDNASMDGVVAHAINTLHSFGYEFDVLVLRDCTVPFIRISDIRRAINLLKRAKCDVVCGVYRQHLNPYFNMMEIGSNGYLTLSKKLSGVIKIRQNAPVVYQLNGLLVINTKQFIKYKKIYMPKKIPYEIPPETGLMIDTEFEFQIADCIARKRIRLRTIT